MSIGIEPEWYAKIKKINYIFMHKPLIKFKIVLENYLNIIFLNMAVNYT